MINEFVVPQPLVLLAYSLNVYKIHYPIILQGNITVHQKKNKGVNNKSKIKTKPFQRINTITVNETLEILNIDPYLQQKNADEGANFSS